MCIQKCLFGFYQHIDKQRTDERLVQSHRLAFGLNQSRAGEEPSTPGVALLTFPLHSPPLVNRDGDKMAPMVEKKIAELEMGLLHLQQNIDIPEITLTVHPVAAATIKRCAEEGRRTTAIDFGDRTEDSSFLNQLQNGVNRWTREIQKACISCMGGDCVEWATSNDG